MSRTSCIEHPANERLIKIHLWQLEFCTGEDGKVNECAAALLSFLEYWHSIKLEMRERNRSANDASERERKGRPYPESLLQWHSTAEIEAGLLIFKRSSIQAAVDLLVKKKAVEVHRNPVLKYDNTRQFLFRPEVLMEWLREHRPNSAGAPAENSTWSAENSLPPAENRRTIPEITTETTTEKTTAKKTKPVVASSSVSPEEKRFREWMVQLANEFGLSTSQLRTVESYVPVPGETYIEEKAALTRSEERKNAGGFFMKALRDDFKPRKRIQKQKVEKPAVQGELLMASDLTEEQRAANIAKLQEAKKAAKEAGK